MKARPACVKIGPHVHVCEEVSSRRSQTGVLESDSEASSEDHYLGLHGLLRSWNCQIDQMHRYRPTAEVRSAISTALFQYPFCFKDDIEQCHRAKLVTNWKCQSNTRTLTLSHHRIRIRLRISGVM